MADRFLTPSPYSTIGPFFPFDFADKASDLTQWNGQTAQGHHIVLTGRVLEAGNQPTGNTILEIWQPDANGIFRHPLDPRFADADPAFFGWGRARTNREGWYRFRTVLPGTPSVFRGVPRSPHINLMVLAIGVTRRLVTTVFFPEGQEHLEDPVLDCVPTDAARRRLYAVPDPHLEGDGLPVYRFDVVLRGENETPFFLD